MSVSSLFVIIIDISFDEDITCALNIKTWDVLSIHDTKTNLIVSIWFWGDIPKLLLFLILFAF